MIKILKITLLFTLVLLSNLNFYLCNTDSESNIKEEEKNLKFLSEQNFVRKALLGADVTVYKITDGLCGEMQLSSTIAYWAEKFGGVSEGNCAGMGYLIFDHTEKVSVGPFGEFEVKIFKKE